MPRASRTEKRDDILAAIDVGTNAVRLELARVLPDGSLETLHTERDPVRPGEGLFTTGLIQKSVADRLVATLRRYAALCKRYGARVRAVATSALREAKNRDEVVRRVSSEAGLSLDVISGREEARLICLGVLHGKPPHQRALCIDIGGGSTEIISATGETPKELWSVDLGAVRLSELFEVSESVSKKRLAMLRDFAHDAMAEAVSGRITRLPTAAIGSSGTIGAIVAYARSEGRGHATTAEISKAVEELAEMNSERRRRRFDPKRADIVVAGAVILEAALNHLRVQTITAVDRGLREGILRELVRRRSNGGEDRSLTDAAIVIGRRFGFGEAHAKQVSKVALSLFDDLAGVHQLPASARRSLEVAALLHDIGHAVNYQRHHKHTHYLIQNVDLPGFSERERSIVAAIARFHRRSPPSVNHEAMVGLSPTEIRVVRKCATILRVADSLDRSHHQPVHAVKATVKGRTVTVHLTTKQSVDLELWDVAHEESLFKEVFGRSLNLQVRQ